MREILFRGKRTDSGKWVEGELLHDMQDRPHLYWKTPKELLIVFSNHAIVDPATLGQFTGMTDKNDKKIFEGDIIKAIAGNPVGDPIVVKVIPNLNDYELMWDIEHSYELEIVGNIHDNPELLEVTDNA